MVNKTALPFFFSIFADGYQLLSLLTKNVGYETHIILLYSYYFIICIVTARYIYTLI